MSENMPEDSPDWNRTTVKYKYDSHGNWIEREIKRETTVETRKRKIYYLNE